jgi:hypothetical protein
MKLLKIYLNDYNKNKTFLKITINKKREFDSERI